MTATINSQIPLRITCLFLLAQIAYPLNIYCLFKNFEFLSKACRQLDNSEGFMVKIYNSLALYAFKVLMLFRAAVKTPDIARAFDDKSDTYLAQCQQCPVHRIE